MLVILLAWIFVSLMCWAWGVLVFQNMKMILKDQASDLPHFSIICLTGVAAVTVFAALLSLFMPLGSWLSHVIIIIPGCILFFQKQRLNFFTQLKNQFAGLHPALLFLLIASLAMVLIMAAWKVNHPDTLGYHAQTIRWIEEYKAVPGLVHLHVRYGYQGLWFVACAFFDLRFAGIDTLTLINSVVILWFLFFAIKKINDYLNSSEWINSILWLLLLAGSFLSYTQIRLTVTSASPDFIATLFLWLIFYLLTKKEAKQSALYWVLIIILSVFSITLKLSAVMIFLIAGYSAIQLIRLKKIKSFIISCLLAGVILVPFFARNIITTGYPAFPSAFPDITNVDWKFDKDLTRLEKDYITAYARTHVDYTKDKIEGTMAMPTTTWLPAWWRNISISDKIILVALMLSFIAAIIRAKRIIRADTQTKTGLIAALAGIIFWFIQAPDPRFGFGFIIAFIGMLLVLLFKSAQPVTIVSKKLLLITALCAAFLISGYTVYRSIYFFSAGQLIKPIGIEKISLSSFQCGDILFHKPEGTEFCGNSPLPCIYTDSCSQFLLRGKTINDGFRGKEKNGNSSSLPLR